MSIQLLDSWDDGDFEALEKGVIVAKHRLLDTGLFSDDALATLLDEYPEDQLSISTMGADSSQFQWRDGHRNNVSGADLIATLKRGHLWINCRNLADNHPAYAQHIDQLYDELEQGNSHFRAENRSANLLISSPSALVHYHIDMPVNMLWHLRGVKRVWVYPHFDTRFASLPVIEKVCAGEWSEDIPYDPHYDRYALTFDVQPGELLTWPQLTPHRVTNLSDMNVSLSTEHKNPRARRRLNVHLANHLLRQRLGWQPRSAAVDGCTAHLKQVLSRIQRQLAKFSPAKQERFTYPKSFVVDPSTPEGFRLISGKEELVAAPHEEDLVGAAQ